jgi:hypothetical protein
MFFQTLEYDVDCCSSLNRFLIKISYCVYFVHMKMSCSLPYYGIKPILKNNMMMLLKIVIGH